VSSLEAAGPQLEGVALLDRLRKNLSSYIEAVSHGNVLPFGHITATSLRLGLVHSILVHSAVGPQESIGRGCGQCSGYVISCDPP